MTQIDLAIRIDIVVQIDIVIRTTSIRKTRGMVTRDTKTAIHGGIDTDIVIPATAIMGTPAITTTTTNATAATVQSMVETSQLDKMTAGMM